MLYDRCNPRAAAGLATKGSLGYLAAPLRVYHLSDAPLIMYTVEVTLSESAQAIDLDVRDEGGGG